MRVADAVRETSVVHRLKIGERFIDSDGEWEVTRSPEVDGDDVIVYCKPFPARGRKRSTAYKYRKGAQVKMLRK